MVDLKVGAGGWAYFQVPGTSSLKAYSSVFDFVELNSTYYDYPSIRTVYAWRKTVPSKFEFAVRCHKDLVQGFKPKSNVNVSQTVQRMEEICKVLRANILAVLIPEKSGLSETHLASGLEETLSTFHAKGTRIAVEFRGKTVHEKALKVLHENDGVHCVDLSREEPAYEANILYSRLFGKGQDNIYEFDDQELRQIADKASAPRFEKSILAFHGVRMYRDAARFKTFREKGQFPLITGHVGLDSLREVLAEDARFPTSKSAIVNDQGWKLFDLTQDRRVRAGEFLAKLPERVYGSLDELVTLLNDVLRT